MNAIRQATGWLSLSATVESTILRYGCHGYRHGFEYARNRPNPGAGSAIRRHLMPEMNGAALIRILRALEPRLHVVALSGLHDQDRREELAALGVTRTLAKPCSSDKILEAVQSELTQAVSSE